MQNLNDARTKASKLLENGKLKEALAYFLSKTHSTPIYQDVLLLSFRLTNIENEFKQGLVTSENHRVSTNQIKVSFLYLLNKEEEDNAETFQVSKPSEPIITKEFVKIPIEQLKNELYNFIANNKLENAVSLFKEQLDTEDKILPELILLKARYKNIQEKVMMGTLSFSSEQKEIAQIGQFFLKLLNTFENQNK